MHRVGSGTGRRHAGRERRAGGGRWEPPAVLHEEHLVRRRMAVSHWNAASIFGGLRSTAQRQTRKRHYFTDLLERNEIVGVVETRGTEADLEQLPRTHSHCRTCFPEAAPGTSAAGGAVIAVRRFVDRAVRVTSQVHARGEPSLSCCAFVPS